ncbi:hypothetical protein P7K49_007124 [Saguinus oedipus]|uniref:KIAA0319-like C-terminal domain-containing protein n=1 Tax=Saguinus oedipus TaxID=9490 RepID=A0ABQ9VTY6_SAGOE|nr:hypothetical protein P7K49_007124 [Saguinus oedipus]
MALGLLTITSAPVSLGCLNSVLQNIDVIDGSDHSTVLQLTNLVEGVYAFHLRVTDSQGAWDTDTATVEVQPDPRKSGLVELTLQVGAGQLTEQRKDTLVRQLAVLLNVLDSDIKVQKIRALSDLRELYNTVIVFYVQSGPPFKVLKAAEVARSLHMRLSKEKTDFLLFKVLRIDTAGYTHKIMAIGRKNHVKGKSVLLAGKAMWIKMPVFGAYATENTKDAECRDPLSCVLTSALHIAPQVAF